MSKHHDEVKPKNLGEFIQQRLAELLGFVLLISLAAFVFLNKTFNLI